MAYCLARKRVRYPQRWILAALLLAILLLLAFDIPSRSLTMPDHNHRWHKDWWQPQRFVELQAEGAFQPWSEQTWRLSLPELQELVAGSNGYYVRDWSVGLGWNNLRYIIEASLLHAKLLNRVLVLPSFVYARSCEFPLDVCSHYGLFVDRAEVVGWDTWSGAPLNTLAWQIPLQVMLDLPHLRETYPVILGSEFFQLHGLDPHFESLAGDWNRGDLEENVTFPSIHVIPNGDYDPSHVIRVDTVHGLPPAPKTTNNDVDVLLKAALGDRKVLQWEDALQALRTGAWKLQTDRDIGQLINSGGWVVVHTFLGAGGMDYTKTVVDPIKQVVPRNRIHGFVEDYSSITAEVLLLEGETHLGRKPGGLLFTTEAAREAFSHLVLFGFRPVPPVRALVKSLAIRMKERCGGRMWMAAHMRRGDFATVGWAMEKSVEAHFARIKNRLDNGRERLGGFSIPETNISGVVPDTMVTQLALPLEGDPFLLATDERDLDGLAYLRNNSAVLIHDILTIEDRRTFGWPLIFTDVLALIEQGLAVESAFFYGHALSSFAGGVLNMRAARGADPRTIDID